MKATDTLDTLLFLADEPDDNLYDYITKAILSYGEKALPSLHSKLHESDDVVLRRRLKSMIEIIERQDVIDKLKLWKQKREYDLMEPCFILAKYRYPKVDWSNVGFHIMMIVEQAEREMKDDLTPLEQIKILNHIIYDINKFRGDTASINNPNYYFINTLLESHIGNPLSLGILYCIVAERVGLPVYGIDLPNHFILAFCKKTKNHPQIEDVLFYINPYNKGVVLTRKDIRKYLECINVKSELRFFEPSNNTLIIKKLFNTLIETYSLSGKDRDANEMREMLKLYC